MTELKIGSVYLRSYTHPTQWKVFKLQRSKKSGKFNERLIGWFPKLEMALNRALEFTVADADCQSVAELKELITNYQQMVKDELSQ